MNRFTRRALFGRATFAVVTLALFGCSGSAQANVQQAITDAGMIIGSPPSTSAPEGTGLQGGYAELKILYPTLVSASVDAQIQAAFAQAPIYLTALSAGAATVTSAAASNLSGIISIGTQILNLLGPVITPTILAAAGGNPLVAAVILAFQAATVLLPFVQGVVSQIAPSQATTAISVPAAFVKPGMTADQARAVLAPK
jgi:hypothetical protein